MRWAYNLMPGYAFGLLGYQMFAFLFDWTDKNWLKRRKAKMFRFALAFLKDDQAHGCQIHAFARLERFYLLVDWPERFFRQRVRLG
jgi:hypothetical protein